LVDVSPSQSSTLNHISEEYVIQSSSLDGSTLTGASRLRTMPPSSADSGTDASASTSHCGASSPGSGAAPSRR